MAQQLAQAQQQQGGGGGGQPQNQGQGGGGQAMGGGQTPQVQGGQGGPQVTTGGGGGQPTTGGGGQTSGGGGGPQMGFSGGNPSSLTELAAHPTFNVIKQVVQQRPEALTQILQEIQRTNPDLFMLISNNREQFINLLKTPVQTDLASQIAQQYTESLGN